MLDDLALPPFIDHYRHAPRRHRLDGDEAEMLCKLGPRVSIYNTDGQLMARLGEGPEGEEPGLFIAPHGICIDSRGDIYVGEVSWTHTGSHLNPPREVRSLQKLARKE